jgi:preprotein translocase subunit YajC
MYIIEFKRGRGRDKKKRKRRTEMGESVRKGAKIGLAVGGVSAALN